MLCVRLDFTTRPPSYHPTRRSTTLRAPASSCLPCQLSSLLDPHTTPPDHLPAHIPTHPPVDDPEFWEGVTPLEFGSLPRLQDQVAVVGYPVGGESISITVGVVSRIEVRA